MRVEKSDLVEVKNPLILQYAFYPENVQTQVDFGSRHGGTLLGLRHSVVPVEFHHHSCNMLRIHGKFPEVIEGDAIAFAEHCVASGRTFEVATGFDFIEHLPRERSLYLLGLAEKIATRALIWFLPEENDEIRARQDFIDRRVDAFKIHVPIDQRELQTHKSDWLPDDFEKLGYRVNFLPNFHMIGVGAFFASKYTNEQDERWALTRQIAEPQLWWGERNSSTGRASMVTPWVLNE